MREDWVGGWGGREGGGSAALIRAEAHEQIRVCFGRLWVGCTNGCDAVGDNAKWKKKSMLGPASLPLRFVHLEKKRVCDILFQARWYEYGM